MGQQSGGGSEDVPGEGSFGDERVGDERVGDERVGDERVGDERVGDERVGDERVGDERVGDERKSDESSFDAPSTKRAPDPRWSGWRVDARSDGVGRTTGGFDALGAPGPFGAASISLLLNMLIERTRSHAWSVDRQRAHARVLIELTRDHWFTDEETAVLCAFLR